MISIYLIAFNEEFLLPYTLKFYQKRFPGCDITVYDNFSTDRTKQIALEHKCQVIDYYTGNKMSDKALRDIKNSCWRNARHSWCIVADVDEWLHIGPEHLQKTNASVIRTRYANMINLDNNFDVNGMSRGLIYHNLPGKCVCFNRTRINEINYSYGAHDCYPIGDVVFSEEIYLLLHYKWINLDYVIKRYKEFGSRLSDHNKRWRHSYHYLFPPRKIRKEFNYIARNAVQIDFERYFYP